MFTAVADASQVAEARRLVREVARRAGLATGEASTRWQSSSPNWRPICSSTAAAAISSPANVTTQTAAGLELLALDRGSGMTDTEPLHAGRLFHCRQSRQGLARSRASPTPTRIYSRPGQGCAVMARFVGPTQREMPDALLGAVLAPYPGEPVCGDNWAWRDAAARSHVMLVDGSGHGVEAARAADTRCGHSSQAR